MRTFLADGENITKTFWTQSLPFHQWTHKRSIWRWKIQPLQPKLPCCQPFTDKGLQLQSAGSCVCFLLTMWYCLHLLKRVLSMYLIGFLLCAKRDWKLVRQKLRFCFYRNPSQCTLQAAMHSSRSRSSSTLAWYSRVTESGTVKFLHGLVNQTHFCLSFIALRWQNGSFQTSQSCPFWNRSLFRFSPMVLDLGKWLKESHVQATKMGF